MSELRTPLTAWHEAHGAKMAPFAGWLMPIQYEGFARTPTYPSACRALRHLPYGRVPYPGAGRGRRSGARSESQSGYSCAGKCRYGFLLNAAGGVLDDCIIYRFGPDAFMIVVNAACAAGDFAALRERLPKSVALTDLSEATAKIDLQGPESVDVLEGALKQNFHDLPYFGFRETAFDGASLLVSRTGYTGELGFELYLPSNKAEAFWTTLLADSRSSPWAWARGTRCAWRPGCRCMGTIWTTGIPLPRRAWAGC